MIGTYKTLLGSKRKEVHTLKRRYQVGLEKLLNAEDQVSTMKQELIDLQPQLIATGKEVDETLIIVNKETEAANEKKEVVEKEEAVANEAAAAAKAIKDDCESELAVAMPMLESALAALDTLTKADITEVKVSSPPHSLATRLGGAVARSAQPHRRLVCTGNEEPPGGGQNSHGGSLPHARHKTKARKRSKRPHEEDQ